jgi:RHS repeat-associated protein
VFSGNTLKQRYLYGSGVDQVLAEDTGTTVRWALADHQGTIRDVTDANGAVINHLRYDSFGKVISQTRPTAFFRFGYTGRETDTESGLMYYRARYYDPGVGRFIGEDPIGFDGGDPNLYRYVGNSPLNYTDPSGLLRNVPARATQARNAHTLSRLRSSFRTRAGIASGSYGDDLDGIQSRSDLDIVPLGGQYVPLTVEDFDPPNYGPGFNFFMWQAIKQELEKISGTYEIAGSSTRAGAESAGEFLSIVSSSQQSQTNQSNKSCTPPPQTQPAYCPQQIPTYIEDGEKFPDHVILVDKAQRTGYPRILTKRPERYDNPLVNAARELFSSQNGFRAAATDFNLQFDEYPYASTYENEAGVVIEPIPRLENEEAGLDLKRFYIRKGIKPGCKFYVKVINVR